MTFDFLCIVFYMNFSVRAIFYNKNNCQKNLENKYDTEYRINSAPERTNQKLYVQ